MKKFTKGDIVYWCHQCVHTYNVNVGVVSNQFTNYVLVDCFSFARNCVVSGEYMHGVPLEDFVGEKYFHPLPVGWNENMQLFQVTQTENEYDGGKTFPIADPDQLKKMLNAGILVRRCEIDKGKVCAEITDHGYRIVKRYSWNMDRSDNVCVLPDKLYFSYNEAKEEVERKRKCLVSVSPSYILAAERIKRSLDDWADSYGITDSVKNQYEKWLLALPDLENIEVREQNRDIQFRDSKADNKWHNIETNM